MVRMGRAHIKAIFVTWVMFDMCERHIFATGMKKPAQWRVWSVK